MWKFALGAVVGFLVSWAYIGTRIDYDTTGQLTGYAVTVNQHTVCRDPVYAVNVNGKFISC